MDHAVAQPLSSLSSRGMRVPSTYPASPGCSQRAALLGHSSAWDGSVVPEGRGCCFPGQPPFRGSFLWVTGFTNPTVHAVLPHGLRAVCSAQQRHNGAGAEVTGAFASYPCSGHRWEMGAQGAAALTGQTLLVGHSSNAVGGPNLTAWFLAGSERQRADTMTSLP